MRALIIGNLTVDHIDNTTRIGGPGFYGGRALAECMGIETAILSGMDDRYRGLFIDTLKRYGIELIEVKCNSIPKFSIYRGKVVGIEEYGCKLPKDLVVEYLKALDPDIVIISPVLQEVDIDLVESIARNSMNRVIALDIQGLVRFHHSDRIEIRWYAELSRVLTLPMLIHGNIAEFAIAGNEFEVLEKLRTSTHRSRILVSLDERGTYLIDHGNVYLFQPWRTKTVDDVGAGDILTAITSLYLARDHDITDAVRYGVAAATLKVSRNRDEKWFTPQDLAEHVDRVIVEKIM